jgi:hypothetical protein
MKKILPFLAFLSLSLWSCEEKPLNIPELTVGTRRVLVEELTGVKCSNCPDGADLLEDLQETFGKENLIVVSIHQAPDFSVPYPGANGSRYDFRTTNGKALADYIGVFEGAPCASVARFLPPNATSLFVTPYSEWPGLITAEFAKDYGLGLFVTTEYDSLSRNVDILVNIAPESTLTGSFALTVVITQDSIVDLQDVNGDLERDYLHRHVLRDVISQPTGNAVEAPLTAGALISQNFRYKLKDTWDAKHCSIVAYVHHTGVPDKEVLQATEVHVAD